MKNYKKILILLAFSLCFSLEAKDLQKIIDMDGRSLELPFDIKRVATVGAVPVLNSFLMSLGEEKKIVNGIPSIASMPKFKYQYIFAPHLKKLEIMQGKHQLPDIEKLLKAKPDIILLMNFHKNMLKSLTQRGFKVVILRLDDAKNMKELISLLGKIFHKEKRAKAYIAYFDEVLKKIKNITEKIEEEHKISALYTVLSSFRSPSALTRWWISTAGAKNVASIKSKAFSIEQLLAYNPDVIMVHSKKELDELYKDPRYKGLKAVKNKKIYISPTVLQVWAHPSMEEPMVLLWALNLFYPQLYSLEELKKDIFYYYDTFFGVGLSKAQIEEILSGVNK